MWRSEYANLLRTFQVMVSIVVVSEVVR